MKQGWHWAWLIVGGAFLVYGVATRPYDGLILGLINFVVWGGIAAGITVTVGDVMHRDRQT